MSFVLHNNVPFGPNARSDPSFDGIRSTPEFGRLQGVAETGHLRAREAFERAGGPQLLRVTS